MRYGVELIILIIILLAATAMPARAVPYVTIQGTVRENKVPEYWVDPGTGLMWAGKDNGRDLTWGKAVKYCRNLRLAGNADWRLPSIGELEGIYDKDANAPGLMGPSGKGAPSTWHVKGNLFLTGMQWSGNRPTDDRGHPSAYAWRFNFNDGRKYDGDEISFSVAKRALCVRTSGRQ
jgi:hypothetical protein